MLKQTLFSLREKIRLNPLVAKSIYLAQSAVYSNFGEFRQQVAVRKDGMYPEHRRVALCCRIRDEAPNLEEFIDYYLAAGVSHFFFYEKLSTDNFREVLQPYIDADVVTLFDNWHTFPVSPAAEHDCILRAIGRYAWVGMLDADEFVVVANHESIPDFLSHYATHPGVALHWRYFGSNGYKTRPDRWVITAYTARERATNRHVKLFVQPEMVARCRNSHSWYFRGMRSAVNELGRPVYGSISLPPTSELAWINHYHHKSDEEYRAKAARKSVLDAVGIAYNNRTQARGDESETRTNEVFDDSAMAYYRRGARRSAVTA